MFGGEIGLLESFYIAEDKSLEDKAEKRLYDKNSKRWEEGIMQE